MANFDSAFKQVKKLVEDFQSNESKFLSSDYQEVEVRRDFIDKFLFALGWDVYHDEQKNPYEQEVKVEKGVYVGKQQKRADYAFHLTPNFRDVKFYVEAKKPSRNLANADDYFQSIRYGWNAGTQITFLTDFEEFHILDCRIKPDISSILNYKIKRYHYSDFLNEDKFAEIYWLLSREAVVNNSLEKFAESLPKPKGKAILKGTHRGIYQSIDEAFLVELDEIRDSLAKAFKKANPRLESEPLTEMTQRLIDRLVFIRFLEDKQIEPDHYVSEFTNSKSAWKDFRVACRKLDAKYNGVVFKKHTIDSDNFIEPDDKSFSSICEELAHVNSPYNFDIIPIHILGSIYERFLGKVVVATDKRVRIEEKPEVRKAGGVYYTPQYIVNYIVDNTVGKLIEGKTPKEISKLRFADISCGSGSFLITVFDRLLEHHRKWYQDNPEQAKKDGCYFQDGKWVLSLKQKQKILTNNIYGVDLDHQAVEVTQLSLYLKLLEDETTATAQDTWVMFKEQLLPNLNNNIVCGNSLIGTDILDLTLCPSPYQGEGQRERFDEMKIKPMNFEDSFPEVMSKGGFDAIVGNPPYLGGREWKENNGRQYEYFLNNYESLEYQFDIYNVFWERAIKTSNKNGLIGFITPNTWLNNKSNIKLRSFLLRNTSIISMVDYSNTIVFKGAVVLPIITILSKLKLSERLIEIYRPFENQLVQVNAIDQKLWEESELKIFNIDVKESFNELQKKIELQSTPLEEIANIKFGVKLYETGKGYPPQKAQDAVNHVYEADYQVNDSYKKFLEGKDINEYLINWKNRWLKYGKNLAAPRDPNLFVGERILVRRIVGQSLIAAYCNDDYITSQLLQIVKPNDPSISFFILGILSSKLMAFYFRSKYNRRDKTFPEIRIYELCSLPIFRLNVKQESFNRISLTVKLLVNDKKNFSIAKTESEKHYFEKKCITNIKQIDQLVYELYGLTEEEIKIVEGN